MFLGPRRSVVPSFSAVLSLEVEEKGEERKIVFLHSAAPSPVVVPDKESPHMQNNKRKPGFCRACRHLQRGCTILAHWQASDKDAACSSCVKLSSPRLGLRLVVVVALSLMSTSLQRNVSCSSSASRAYASFPTTRTETQRTGVLVQLKEQQSNLFSHHGPSRPPKISNIYQLELSRRCNRTE